MTATRLYVICARQARRAVVFRRGPSGQVRLLLWHLDEDRFEGGQWFKGRIYERRCDLSPDGERLLYFAADYSRAMPSWTAVSKPPFLTALALWPKGDGWGGGGLFDTDRRLALNHRAAEMALADGFELQHGLRVEPLPGRPGWGEDFPIWDVRLGRDGWSAIGEAKEHENPYDTAKIWVDLDPPITYRKPSPTSGTWLEMRIRGLKERDGPWYVIDHAVQSADGAELALPRTDWADWDETGDLLHARDGRLYRLAAGELDEQRAVELIDLRTQVFEGMAAPSWAQRW